MNLQTHQSDYMQKRSQQGQTDGETNATLGCIAYVTQDIILSPNTAPVSLRGTTATHSEHSNSWTKATRKPPDIGNITCQERLRELRAPT